MRYSYQTKMKNRSKIIISWSNLLVCSLFIVAVVPLTGFAGSDSSQSTETKAVEKAKNVQEDLAGLIESKLVEPYLFVGGGSGVIISENGEFLTNYHVVKQLFQQEKSSRIIEVERVGGETHKALIVGADPVGDIALGKIIDDSDTLPKLSFGEASSLSIGQYVLAIGNPFLKGKLTAQPTITFGTISALHVTKPSYGDSIQTDAPINPGNSGGPLVNLEGELIGINGRIETKFGTRSNSGAGFAISSAQIRRFLPHLKKGGIVFHANFPDGMRLKREIQEGGGVVVDKVKEGSPVHRSGVREGDEIIRINEYSVETWVRFHGIIQSLPANTEAEIEVRRDDQTKIVSIQLDQVGSWSNSKLVESLPTMSKGGYLGVELSRKNEEVVISRVVKGSPADQAGLTSNQVIRSINDRIIPNVDAAIRMIQSRWIGESLHLQMIQNDQIQEKDIILGSRQDYENTSDDSW